MNAISRVKPLLLERNAIRHLRRIPSKRWFANIFDLNVPEAPDFEEMISDAQARGAPVSLSNAYTDMKSAAKEGKNALQAAATYNQLISGGMTSVELGVRGEVKGHASFEEMSKALSASKDQETWEPERNLTQGELVNTLRPKSVQDAMRAYKSKLPARRTVINSGVQAGGKAYPYFIDVTKGRSNNHNTRSKDVGDRKNRVMHIYTLKKQTGLDYTTLAAIYDDAGSYSATLDVIRKQQIKRLVKETGKTKKECEDVFDYCIGDYKKALRKLQLKR